ncbi:MAG: anhydro-N-acetylmuramic acid kinase [Ignavibacteriales bacterium]|nr:anhydro-N-acetylmuramic acid kinase [Ignavibacteriales bacterium]
MEVLIKLFNKKKKIVVGLMSGTSADGIDAALVEVSGSGENSHLRLIKFITVPYPKGYKEVLLKNSDERTAKLDEMARLDMLIAEFFADAVKKLSRKSEIPMNKIDLIGSHGQTIHHLPNPIQLFGKNIRSTMQIGNPSAIAKLTGIVTVGDFRMGDVAVGGTGAPLVPYFDFIMFRSKKINRALLNIGGIANITVLPKNCNINQVTAFDTGPGNMIVDGLIKKLYNQAFDKNGEVASSGKLTPLLLQQLITHPYLRMPPPKSTGRELFGKNIIDAILNKHKSAPKQDIIATVTEFTALSIYLNYLEFVQPKTKIDELLVSGGGVHNKYMMDALKRYFGNIKVGTVENIIPSDAKEAVCFAMLANELISGNPTNMPSVTGAKKRTLLGTIALP